ncbi:hypothetical protein SAMN05428989_1601 [Pseudoxanthomonas sp. GM95]|uniref:hypothetical protein n=1 Tax=Pseudoxanthomonas sp. GM95 TaxID=1881043 RepID=UPI0008BECAD0|nr:hypothetical protein [Pseudoxanthomonas sp. GM95]SEL17128.1 hypothetical protein SAMN05428989_1601 [Pseudoxanthomonas sp. GM95]
MNFNVQQRQVLESIRDGRKVSEMDANWAVNKELATQGEDGDIDLTQLGRSQIDRSPNASV